MTRSATVLWITEARYLGVAINVAAAVTLMRPPNDFERQTPNINCIVIVAGRVQALLEDFKTAYDILQVGGTHVPEVMVSLKTLHGEVQGYSLAPPKEPELYQVW